MKMKVYISEMYRLDRYISVYNYYNLYVCTLGKGYTRTSLKASEELYEKELTPLAEEILK